MAKAKKKRLAKDLEKLWRTGKYWEWVELASKIDALNLPQPQWQEAWRYLSPEDLLAAFHKQLLFSHLWELSPETAGKRRNPSKPPSSEDPD